jgi:hypothetical protein
MSFIKKNRIYITALMLLASLIISIGTYNYFFRKGQTSIIVYGDWPELNGIRSDTIKNVLKVQLEQSTVNTFSANEFDKYYTISQGVGLTKFEHFIKEYAPIFFFILMVIGMYCNQIFENLSEQKEAGKTRVNVGEVFSEGLTGTKFWMALVVSPLIFYATYLLIKDLPSNNNLGYFYSFQNGFFWQFLFNKLKPSKPENRPIEDNKGKKVMQP